MDQGQGLQMHGTPNVVHVKGTDIGYIYKVKVKVIRKRYQDMVQVQGTSTDTV